MGLVCDTIGARLRVAHKRNRDHEGRETAEQRIRPMIRQRIKHLLSE